MRLSNLAVKKPVTITMIVLIIVLLGTISLSRLPIDLFPEIEIPVAVVVTSYSSAGPQEIENLITEKIENSIATVSNIDKLDSISSEGSSVVIAQFNYGTDMDFATLEMREKLDLIKRALPEDSDVPMVLKIDPNSMPIMQISLSSGGDLSGLQTLAEDTFSQRLERIDGVASVNIGGGFSNEIEILVDQNQLVNYGLSIDQLSQVLRASNMDLPGGSINKGDEKLSIRVKGEFDTIEEIKNSPIILGTGNIISFQDIASVKLVKEETTSISRTNGKDSINISIQKQSGKNTVKIANSINKELDQLSKDYDNVEIDVVLDSSTIITDSINTVVRNVITGSILAIIVLYVFLKNWRSTFIVGVSIPISLIASFILLYFNGITLNMMTLGGLALAVGMLVDSAIVVLENIYRYRSLGYSRIDSAIKGAAEVEMSIIASTITTIAVFLPIVFIEGMVGSLFKDFALTVTLSLLASLVVAITFIPMLSSKILTVELGEGDNVKKKKLDFIFKPFDKLFEKVENIYRKILGTSLKHRKTTIFISVLVFIISMTSLIGVPIEFFPTMDEGNITIDISMPLGTKIEKIDNISNLIEEKLSSIEEVDVMFANIGSGGAMSMGMDGGTSNSAQVVITLKKLSERNRSTAEVVEEVRYMLKDIPGIETSVSEGSSMGMAGMTGDPISISISGSNLDTLEDISNDFKTIIESVEGTREVETSLSEAVPEIEVVVNKNIAASYGLTTAQVASAVRSGTVGSTSTKLKQDGEEINIIIKASGDITEKLSNFEELDITSPAGMNIPLSQLAEISVVKGPVEIARENQERTVTVTGDIIGRDLTSVISDINNQLKEYDISEGYYYKIGGENEDIMEAFGQLAMALALAIVLIYMVMAGQFESLINPFVIMFTIPLAFSGGILGLFLTRKAFGVTAFIGIIMLAGIVVNNGIVLIDYINILRKEGKGRDEAVNIAGPIRLRPILMTTLTTVLGLVPLALGIGEGSEIQAPMAVVVIGGLTLSTVLTLIFVPVLYTIFDDISKTFKSKLRKGSQDTSEA